MLKIGVGYYQPYGKNEIPLADSGKQFKDAFFTDDDKNYEITTKDGVDGIFYSPKILLEAVPHHPLQHLTI